MDVIAWLMSQEDKEQFYDIDVRKKKKSLQANDYFWVLVNEVAKKQRLSDAEVHDRILSENRYYYFNEDGGIDWKVSPKAPNSFGLIVERGKHDYAYYVDSGMNVRLQKDDGSLCKGKDGVVSAHVYWHIKGIHQMDSRELSRCIESIKFEAQQLGIPTMSETEMERLLKAYEERFAKK